MSSLSIVLQQAISVFTQVIKFIMVVRILLTLFMRLRLGSGFGGVIINFVFAFTEPIIGPLRSLLQRSPVSGANFILDFSPLFAFFLIDAASIMLISLAGLITI